MSKLIDLFASTKLMGYETYHLLLRVVFNGIFIKAFHSEFEVIDFYSVKTDTRWIKTYPKLSLFYIIDKALTSSVSRLKLDLALKKNSFRFYKGFYHICRIFLPSKPVQRQIQRTAYNLNAIFACNHFSRQFFAYNYGLWLFNCYMYGQHALCICIYAMMHGGLINIVFCFSYSLPDLYWMNAKHVLNKPSVFIRNISAKFAYRICLRMPPFWKLWGIVAGDRFLNGILTRENTFTSEKK